MRRDGLGNPKVKIQEFYGTALRYSEFHIHKIMVLPIRNRNYSGTLTPTNRKRFSIFINNLPIYKSIQ